MEPLPGHRSINTLNAGRAVFSNNILLEQSRPACQTDMAVVHRKTENQPVQSFILIPLHVLSVRLILNR